MANDDDDKTMQMMQGAPLFTEPNLAAAAVWRLRNEVSPLRISTKELPDGTFTTGIKNVSEPQHEGYVEVMLSLSRVEAVASHHAVHRIVRTALSCVFRDQVPHG